MQKDMLRICDELIATWSAMGGIRKFYTKACQNNLRGLDPPLLLYRVVISHASHGKFPFLAYCFGLFDFLIILNHQNSQRNQFPLTPVSL